MSSKKFVIFDNHHLAPIDDICPEAVKRAAELACTHYQGDENLKHVTALNHIAKTLGFCGGFGRYKAEYEEKLSGFMQEHGLVERKDVLPSELPDQFIRLTHRQIADRLFVSGRPRPKRIFVGIDTFDLLRAVAATDGLKVSEDSSGNYDEIEATKISERVPPARYYLFSRSAHLNVFEANWYFRNLIGDQLCDFRGKVNDVQITALCYCMDKETEAKTKDAGSLLQKIIPFCPAGWVEVIPYNDKLVFLKASDGGYDFVFRNLRDTEFKQNSHAPYLRYQDISTKIDDSGKFDTWLYFEYKDWLEADRHAAENEFYANGGTTRSYPGENEILKKYLIRTGRYTPKCVRYSLCPGFSRAALPDRDLCFSNLVTVREFKKFLQENPRYVKHRNALQEFQEFLQENPDYADNKKTLQRFRELLLESFDDISNMDALQKFKMSEFKEFLQNNPDDVKRYTTWHALDTLGHLDNEDPEAPAAVTWYDAKAYARWYEKCHAGIPVRLPGEEEWRFLAGELIPGKITLKDKEDAISQPLCDFYDSKGVRYAEGHPPSMAWSEFDFRWQLRYKQPSNLVLERSKSGLEVVRSVWFGEWLQLEGAAINGLFGESQYLATTFLEARESKDFGDSAQSLATLHEPVSAERARFASSNTGKYKGMKIGFRLVYDAEAKK